MPLSPSNVVETSELMRPIAHFSHAVRIDDTIYVGATAGTDSNLRLAGDYPGRVDAKAQSHRMFGNLAYALEKLGGQLSDVVQLKSYLVDVRDADAYGGAFKEAFGRASPAHAVVGAWHFPLPQAVVELDAIAIVGAANRLKHDASDSEITVVIDDYCFTTAGPHVPRDDRDFASQTTETFTRLRAALGRSGYSPRDVVRLHVTLADPRYLAAFDRLSAEAFSPPYPARTVVAATLLYPSALLQVECLAVRGGATPVGTPSDKLGPASPAMLVGETLYTSAIFSTSVGPQAQAAEAWSQVNALMQSCGMREESVLRTNNVLSHWLDFPAFNRAYNPNVAWPYPPRTTVLGQLASAPNKVQIEAIAHRRADEARILQVPREPKVEMR